MATSGSMPLPLRNIAYYKNIMEDDFLRATKLQDADLCRARPCLDSYAEVIQYSGGWAVIFKLKSGNNYWAARFFHRNYTKTIRDRLIMISRFVKLASLPFLVNFSFMPNGVAGDTHFYPLVKMPWVEGNTLYDYIDAYVLKRDKMVALAEKWKALCRMMSAAGIAHGDLHPDNIFVDLNGNLKLVDYDGMYTPAMQKFNLSNVSDGKKDYQHPDRENSSYFGPACDNFSSLIIYVSIAALCHMPDLWKTKNGDRLIADLDPETLCKGTPRSLRRLAKIDPGLNACLGELTRASTRPLEETRELHDVLTDYGSQVQSLSLFSRVYFPRALKKETLLKLTRALPQSLKNLDCGRMAKLFFWKQLLWSFASAAKAEYSSIALFLFRFLLKAKQQLLISAGMLWKKMVRAFQVRNDERRWRNFLKWIGIGALVYALAASYSEFPAQLVPQQVQPKTAPEKKPYARTPFLPASAGATPKSQPAEKTPPPPAGAAAKSQPAKKPSSPPSKAKVNSPLPLPAASAQASYVNTGIRTDRKHGKGYYERWFDRLYGKGSFKKYLGAYYQNNYKAGKEMSFAKSGFIEMISCGKTPRFPLSCVE